MLRGLAAPLSAREISHLQHLQQGQFEPVPISLKRFIMLGLVQEMHDGFAITKLGQQRLNAELDSANRNLTQIGWR